MVICVCVCRSALNKPCKSLGNSDFNESSVSLVHERCFPHAPSDRAQLASGLLFSGSTNKLTGSSSSRLD